MDRKLSLLLECPFHALHQETQKAIYYEFYNLVYGPIMYIIKDHSATEDIIQEAFLKVIEHVPETDQEERFIGWIRVVVKNTTYSYIRKFKKTRNLIDIDSVLINGVMSAAATTETIEQEVELKALAETIGKLLDEVKPEYRTLMELRWKKGLSYKEIAEIVGTSEQSVKSQLHRTRELIKKKLLHVWGDQR